MFERYTGNARRVILFARLGAPSGTAEAVPFHDPLPTTPFQDRDAAFLLLRFQ
jgi:hypothetical protein